MKETLATLSTHLHALTCKQSQTERRKEDTKDKKAFSTRWLTLQGIAEPISALIRLGHCQPPPLDSGPSSTLK